MRIRPDSTEKTTEVGERQKSRSVIAHIAIRWSVAFVKM